MGKTSRRQDRMKLSVRKPGAIKEEKKEENKEEII